MKPRVLTLAVIATLVAAVLWRDRRAKTTAAENDGTTWGAMDPTWSPDGRQIGFTLFGSIWRVPAEGGTAVQITSGPGYHAHPAWSPQGDRIAFITGNAPASILPNISGRLMLAHVETGAEREVATPYPTAGTPAWSPDGRRIVCPLNVTGAGALLYEIDVPSGRSRALQVRPQRGLTGGWITTSWNPKAEEIYFTGQRLAAVQNGSQKLGSPQVYAMPAGADPVMVQLPLTRYRLTDIAQLHSVAALPDGSGAIYSAVIVNGKGDRELYRVGRDGANPIAITNTPRDEFSPAVSPDGKLVAHASNHLGNLDIFTIPVAGGEKKHVALTELKFRRPSARLRVRTVDENGRPTPARLFLRASDGKAYAPRGMQIFYYGVETAGGREGFFLTTGDDTVTLPAGVVKLVALKGVEYRMEDRSVDVAPDGTTDITIALRRWTNWNQKGWYTGENHFHANYNGVYYQRPPDSQQWLQAEDLNAANMIVANSEGGFVHDKEFFTGGVSTASKPSFLLYWGQEYRNSDPLGHMAFLNIGKQVPPSFTSVVGSNSPYDYPLNTQSALEARKQGGVVVYVHPTVTAFADVMDTNLGAKEAPLTAALGAMDGIDVMPYGPMAFEMWYRLLNCGFRIVPGAGTDVFTNWRGINRIPGSSRQYVEVGSNFTWDRWVQRYREGHVFVTNGPLITLTANGQTMGSVVKAPAGAPYRVRLVVELESQVPVETLEIVENGKVIATEQLIAGVSKHRVEKDVTVERSAWFAARVSGLAARGLPNEAPRAHTGAVFVHVGGKPVMVKEDAELMIRWLNALWGYLEERNNYGSAVNRAAAQAMFGQGISRYKKLLSDGGV